MTFSYMILVKITTGGSLSLTKAEFVKGTKSTQCHCYSDTHSVKKASFSKIILIAQKCQFIQVIHIYQAPIMLEI